MNEVIPDSAVTVNHGVLTVKSISVYDLQEKNIIGQQVRKRKKERKKERERERRGCMCLFEREMDGEGGRKVCVHVFV